MMIVYNVVMVLCLLFSVYFGITCLFAFKRKKVNIQNNKWHKFGILIPSRNEEEVIGDILDSLDRQDYPKDYYSIYVIPNNCTDKTREVAINKKAQIIDIDIPVKSKGEVLNYTFQYLENTDIDAYVIFDADNIVDRNFLQAMNEELNNGYQVVQGFRDAKIPNDNYLTGGYTMFYYIQNTFLNQSRRNLNMSAVINGTGFCVLKSVIDEYGFSVKTLTEDSEFTGLCALRGIKIGYASRAITYDEHPTDFKVSWKQRKRWSSGSLACLTRYGTSLFKNFVHNNSFVSFDCLLYYLAPVIQVVSFILPLIVMISKLIYGLFNGILILDISSVIFFVLFYLASIILNIFVIVMLHKKVRDYYKGIFGFSLFLLSWIPINLICMIHPTKKWEPIKHKKLVEVKSFLN